MSGTLANSSEKSYTTEQYIQLCSNELTNLDAMLSEYALKGDNNISGTSTQTHALVYSRSATSNVPFLTQHQLIISKGSVDGYKTVDAATLSGLHNFISRIFSLYDKLQSFIQKNASSQAELSLRAEAEIAQKHHINEIFEQWYSLGVSLKDRLVAVNSFPELSLTLAAFQPKHIAKLWRLSRLLRTFVWTRKNLVTSGTSATSNSSGDYASDYEQQKSSSISRSYFGK